MQWVDKIDTKGLGYFKSYLTDDYGKVLKVIHVVEDNLYQYTDADWKHHTFTDLDGAKRWVIDNYYSKPVEESKPKRKGWIWKV